MSQQGERAPRYRVGDLKIIYDTGDAFWTAPVVNVSETGLFVETTHELPVGTRVSLWPDSPDEDGLPFEVQAEVVRVQALDLDGHWDRTPGLALKMVDMAPEQVEQFRSYLKACGVPEDTHYRKRV